MAQEVLGPLGQSLCALICDFCLEQTPLLRRAEDTTSLDDMLSSGKVYVLLFGLSIHSFFEGLGTVMSFNKPNV